MKNMKKVIAVLLCLCMALSAMVFTVSAEDAAEEPKAAYFNVFPVQATKLKEGDDETVLRMELTINSTAAFDTVNQNAEIAIYGFLYSAILQFKGDNSDEGLQKAMVGKAKPVSYENGVLTVDVYSKDGKPGAKMVAADLEISAQGETIHQYYGVFRFDFPRGLLSDSVSGVISADSSENDTVEGLATKTIKCPKLIANLIVGIIDDYMHDDIAGIIGKVVLALPLLPVSVLILAARAKDYCKVYGLNSYQIAFDMIKLIPEIIKGLFTFIR